MIVGHGNGSILLATLCFPQFWSSTRRIIWRPLFPSWWFTFPTYAQRSNSNSGPCSLIFPSQNCWSTLLSGTYSPCWFMSIKLPSLKRQNIQRLRLGPFIMLQDSSPLKSCLVPTVEQLPGRCIRFASSTSCVIHGRSCFLFSPGTVPKEFFEGLLYGPSMQITCHNKALIHSNRSVTSCLSLLDPLICPSLSSAGSSLAHWPDIL